MKRKLAAALMGLAFLIPAAPGAAQPKPEAEPRGGPIAISADRLETDDETGVANFIGDVMARQGGLTITCDLMKVHYAAGPAAESPESPGPESPPAAAREIDRVEGFGRVRMADGDRLATGDHALYLAKSRPRRLILTGNARLWQGRDSLAGQKVTYFIDEKRSLVEGTERRRVNTVIHGAGTADAK